jgi:four helix bundle protein
MNQPTRLHHEQLDVYQRAIEFVALAAGILNRYARGYGAMSEQLRRAALSIPLNIAEGYGKRSEADRSRFYAIARGSSHECAALLDVSRVLGVADADTVSRGKGLLYRIVSMLVNMTT